MSVGIYQTSGAGSRVSADGDLTNPVVFKFSNAGGVEERKLYLRHNILAGPTAEGSQDVVVDPVDIATLSGDESTWIQIAPDVAGVAGTYGAAGASWIAGNVNIGQIKPFWVKTTVPANTEVGARDDLALQVSSTSTTDLSIPVSLSSGTYVEGASYDVANNKINFSLSRPETSHFLSEWMDVTFATAISGMTYSQTSPLQPVYPTYRTADDNTGLNATAWFENPADLDMTKNFLQVRLSITSNIKTTYNSVTDFALGTQGQNQWYYEWANIGSFVYNHMLYNVGGQWSRNATVPPYCLISGDNMHPDGQDSVRAWKAPADGTISVTATGNVRKASSSNDGIYAWIYLNESSTPLWSPGLITSTGGTAQPTINLSVVTGDAIRFRVNQNGNSSSDTTIWAPNVTFTPVKTISNIRVLYAGTHVENFDIRFWNGPATPELILPVDGDNTDDFNPLLSAVSTNVDYIQFQLDSVNTFDSSNLTEWEVPATNDVPVESQSPIFDRPPGVWYWRARAKLNGIYGTWTDYRTLTINPFVGLNQYLYVNINSGFEQYDTIIFDRHLYINVSVGAQEISIYVNRHIYINVNNTIAVGEVIYPIFDRTTVRKQNFTEDSEAF